MSYSQKQLMVMHGGEGFKYWAWFGACGPGHPAVEHKLLQIPTKARGHVSHS